MALAKIEQETIINFNQEEAIAYIFTCDQTWQKHLEQKLGLKPTERNSSRGRSYELPKKQIALPRKPRKVTEARRKGLEKARRTLANKRKSSVVTEKTGKRKGK